MKKLRNFFAILMSVLLVSTGVVACGNKTGGGGGLDADGNYKPNPNGKVTNVTFWGAGDETEKKVFENIVAEFNELYSGQIKVNYEHKSDGDYATTAESTLRKSKGGADVLYVKEPDFKGFAEKGYLEPLDQYISNSNEVVIEDMWETSVNRYKYDINTQSQDGPNAHYWGIPKDIGPTVIYYNETFFKQAGVKVISVAKEDLAKFNAGEADARGQTKATLGLDDEVKEKGYFVDGNNQKWFNNQVPMSWDEVVTLSNVLQNAIAVPNTDTANFKGFFTEWWFNYGWSVGGDCIEFVADSDPAYNGGYYDFTLMDATPNFIVADDNEEGFTVNGTKYNAGEIISWQDKLVDVKASTKTIRPEILTAKNDGKLNQLPSQRDAFVEFVKLSQPKQSDVGANYQGEIGYGISPTPDAIQGDSAKGKAFASGSVGMVVDGRWSVVYQRNVTDGVYEWDVAPLPMYKEYDAQGNITVHGIEAGHSGSVGLCINKKSQKKVEAWLFAEYVGGRTGQQVQAESGFAIPSQKALANSEVFLQSNKNPKNAIVFVRAAEHQTPADWWYLRDKEWTVDWADVLNTEVRNGRMTLAQFEQNAKYLATWEKLKEYTKKPV